MVLAAFPVKAHHVQMAVYRDFPQEPLLQTCSSASRASACIIAQGFFSPICICPCSTSQGFCQPIPPACLGPSEWQPCPQAYSPNSLSSANIMRVYSVTSSTSLIKIINGHMIGSSVVLYLLPASRKIMAH